MSTTGTVVIVIVVILIVAAVVAAGISQVRRRRLRERFGPEYDRVVEEKASRRQAEAELTQREKRVKGFDIHPLDPAVRTKHADQWRNIQERFVDMPQDAVAEGQALVITVMTERGYPTDHKDQVLADLSVEHAQTLHHYRAASYISGHATSGTATTEDLRQAMIHYRALFQDLLGEPAGDPEAVPGDETVPGDEAVPRDEALTSDEKVTSDEEALTRDPGAPDPGPDVPVLDEHHDIHQTPRT